MTPLQKKFTQEYSKELLRVATGDLQTAKVLVDHPLGRPENTFFLLQQVVEKSLKAVLCHRKLAIPLTHDISALIALIPSTCSAPPNQKALLALTEFASIRRYEEGNYEYTAEETHAAYLAVADVLKWACQLIKKK